MFQLHKNKINPNYLFNEIVRLKKIVNEPHQHLIEYFDQMKNEIDLEFEHVLNHLKTDVNINKTNISGDLKTSWIDIITEIDNFKNECSTKNLTLFALSQYIEQISKIEDELKLVLRSKNILDIVTQNQMKFKKIKKLINVLNFDIEKFLFNNKTIIYIDRKKCNEYELLNEFVDQTTSNNFQDLIGRLIIIQDYYLKDFEYTNLFSR